MGIARTLALAASVSEVETARSFGKGWTGPLPWEPGPPLKTPEVVASGRPFTLRGRSRSTRVSSRSFSHVDSLLPHHRAKDEAAHQEERTGRASGSRSRPDTERRCFQFRESDRRRGSGGCGPSPADPAQCRRRGRVPGHFSECPVQTRLQQRPSRATGHRGLRVEVASKRSGEVGQQAQAPARAAYRSCDRIAPGVTVGSSAVRPGSRRIALGHAKADVTQVYAERDCGLAAKVAVGSASGEAVLPALRLAFAPPASASESACPPSDRDGGENDRDRATFRCPLRGGNGPRLLPGK